MEYKAISNHQLVRADISQEAQALIDSTDDPVRTLDEVKDQTMAAIEKDYAYVPDINAIYPYQVNVAYGAMSLWAVCKARGFRKATLTAGWFIGVLTPDEYGKLLLADNLDRDAVMIAALGVDTEAALKWTAHY